jgi:hypothetical protein
MHWQKNARTQASGLVFITLGSSLPRWDQRRIGMKGKIWLACAFAVMWAVVASGVGTGQDKKPVDEGKGVAFKSKTYEMKEKGEVSILLSFSAGKEVTVTTDGEKQSDVHLFIYGEDKKEVGKDTSPGPKCEVKFNPKADGKFNLLVRNVGPGANKVTLEVKVAK